MESAKTNKKSVTAATLPRKTRKACRLSSRKVDKAMRPTTKEATKFQALPLAMNLTRVACVMVWESVTMDPKRIVVYEYRVW